MPSKMSSPRPAAIDVGKLSGAAQGPSQRKLIGRPSWEAASTRIVAPGRSGCGPSQAARSVA